MDLPSELRDTLALMDSALALLAHNKNTATPAFGCPACGQTRGTVAGLQYHLKNRVCLRATLRDARTTACRRCNRSFETQADLAAHTECSPDCVPEGRNLAVAVHESSNESGGVADSSADVRMVDAQAPTTCSDLVPDAAAIVETNLSSPTSRKPKEASKKRSARKRSVKATRQVEAEASTTPGAGGIDGLSSSATTCLDGISCTRSHVFASQAPDFILEAAAAAPLAFLATGTPSPEARAAAKYARALWDDGLPAAAASTISSTIEGAAAVASTDGLGPAPHRGVIRLPPLNCGGPVWGLDVVAVTPSEAPAESGAASQTRTAAWIAVSAHAPGRSLHVPGSLVPVGVCSDGAGSRNALQIWSVDAPREVGAAAAHSLSASLRLCLVHDCDNASAIAWCPQASPEPSQEAEGSLGRIGVLAAAMGDGCVRVYAVPHPSDVAPAASAPVSIRLVPIAVFDLRAMGGATCLQWHPVIPGLLLAGLASGSVATLDVSCLSPSALHRLPAIDVGTSSWALGFASSYLSSTSAVYNVATPAILPPLALYARGKDAALGPLNGAVRCVSWNPVVPSEFAAGYISGAKRVWRIDCVDTPIRDLSMRLQFTVSRVTGICSSHPLDP
jgi:hypothetical protein